MTLKQYWNSSKYRVPDSPCNLRYRIRCKDGFSVSVQRSRYHHCDLWAGLAAWDKPDFTAEMSFELGFPSEKDDLIMQYADEPDNPMDTVYNYVPKAVVEELIKRHDGFNIEAIQEAINNG